MLIVSDNSYKHPKGGTIRILTTSNNRVKIRDNYNSFECDVSLEESPTLISLLRDIKNNKAINRVSNYASRFNYFFSGNYVDKDRIDGLIYFIELEYSRANEIEELKKCKDIKNKLQDMPIYKLVILSESVDRKRKENSDD